MDDQPHTIDPRDLPVPINPESPSVSRDEAETLDNTQVTNSTVSLEQPATMSTRIINQGPGEDSSVSAPESFQQLPASPAKNGLESPDLVEHAAKQELETLETEDRPANSQSQTGKPTIDQQLDEIPNQDAAESPHEGTSVAETNSSVKGKEPEHTASEGDDASAKANAPRIGFKHDPAEEAMMGKLELDVDDEKKKKKKKKRPKSQRGKNAPTGFEPFYADAPITPAEFEENKRIYDPALPVLDRIDEAIKRFLFKRRLEPDRRKVFLKYLQYGGVTVGQNHNQGVTPQELKEMDKEEAMQARSNTAIFSKDGVNLPVAFNDVATGYLTGYFMGYYNPETEDEIKVCTGTMKNFFTYLLYHNVCPEHAEDLEEARKTCDRCEKELWLGQKLVTYDGPGHFNRSCSMLFGGYYFDAVDNPDAWEKIRGASKDVFTREIARKVIRYAIALNGDDWMTLKFKCLAESDDFPIEEIQDIDGFEILSIEYPSEEADAYYRALAPDLIPVGKVKAKEFRDPSRGPYDLTPSEKIDWDAGRAPAYKFEFFVEGPILDLMLPGMKFITTVYETNFGVHYYDEILNVLPSNYLFLYNEWMIDYKEPKPVDWVGDEIEIARRAENMIVHPPEPTEKEWALHMLTTEMRWTPRFSPWIDSSPRAHAESIVKALELVGYSMEGIREKLGLVEQQKAKKVSKEETTGHEGVDEEPVSKELVKEESTEERVLEEGPATETPTEQNLVKEGLTQGTTRNHGTQIQMIEDMIIGNLDQNEMEKDS